MSDQASVGEHSCVNVTFVRITVVEQWQLLKAEH